MGSLIHNKWVSHGKNASKQSLYAYLNQLDSTTDNSGTQSNGLVFVGSDYAKRVGGLIQFNTHKMRAISHFFKCEQWFVWTPLGWCFFSPSQQWVRPKLKRILVSIAVLGIALFTGWSQWLVYTTRGVSESQIQRGYSYPIAYQNWVDRWNAEPIDITYLAIDSDASYSIIGVLTHSDAMLTVSDADHVQYATRQGKKWAKVSGRL